MNFLNKNYSNGKILRILEKMEDHHKEGNLQPMTTKNL